MINPEIKDKLYNRISRDLVIYQYEEEDISDYHNRLIFSALGKRILTLFKDADFDFASIDDKDDAEYFISKSHVTLGAQNFLSNMLNIDPSLKDFLVDEKATKQIIKSIENIYENFGYVFSGNYNYKRPDHFANLKVGTNSLSINSDINAKTMFGLGNWKYISTGYIEFKDFMPCKLNALDTFNELINNLSFENFSEIHGDLKVYDVERRMWADFDKNSLNRFEYYVLKVDNGLDYKILKKINENILAASLPNIYKIDNQNVMFKYEIWRIIFGLCAYCGHPAVCYKTKYTKEGYMFKFAGYVLPFSEYALLNLMAWPYKHINNYFAYIINAGMIESVKTIMNHLCIEVVEND